jgi:SAM-dependent methyltransferase
MQKIDSRPARRDALSHLICPVTRETLARSADGQKVTTPRGDRSYPLVRGSVPVILRDPELAAKYAVSSDRMSAEYTEEALAQQRTLWRRIKARLIYDYRSEKSRAAFDRVFASADGFHLAIGGGPTRAHPTHVNLNIGPFPNVDIVSDAHELPYEDGSVDAIYVEAVLEHLQRPAVAVAEMYRVLRPGGRVFASTPFMQAYHGYPDHYQNYTITGHKLLFETAGFTVEEAGAQVGPMFAIVNLTATFLRTYLPGGRVLSFLWGAVGTVLRPFDVLLHRHSDAYVLASTTYLVAAR